MGGSYYVSYCTGPRDRKGQAFLAEFQSAFSFRAQLQQCARAPAVLTPCIRPGAQAATLHAAHFLSGVCAHPSAGPITLSYVIQKVLVPHYRDLQPFRDIADLIDSRPLCILDDWTVHFVVYLP